MKIDVVTLFPKMFDSPFAESMIKRAIEKNILDLKIHDMRQWAWNNYKAVDDHPYGGDIGMLIRVDVIANAIKDIKSTIQSSRSKVILTSARGKRLTQEKVEELSNLDNMIILCGHYEGFDQRIADHYVDEEISIGDFVMTGGELAAMVIIDSTVRLKPGVLGKDESSHVESFSGKDRNIEHPQYTRPFVFEGHEVPKELLSGNPKTIKEWQLKQSK